MTHWKSRTIIGYGCGPGSGADQVISVFDIRDPIAQRFVHGVFERARAGGHRDNLSTQQTSSGKTFGFWRSTSVAPM